MNNLENKSIDFGKIETVNNTANSNFSVNRSISTSKYNFLNPNNINNSSNNNSVSPEKHNNKKEYNNANSNYLSKYLNNPSTSNNTNKNVQNTNQPLAGTLEEIISENNHNYADKTNKNANAAANIKRVEISIEPNSSASHNQKFPSDNSAYSNKFLTKNLTKYFLIYLFLNSKFNLVK